MDPADRHEIVELEEHAEAATNVDIQKFDGDERKVLCGITLPMSRDLFNILWMGFGFFLIVSTFIGTQNVQSQLNGKVGYVGLAIVYVSYAICAPFCAPLVERLGERNSFLLGGLGFFLYISSNIHMIPAVYYTAAFLCGTGAAIFWVAQGVYLNRFCTEKNRDRFNSIFVAFLASGHFVGNGITFLSQFSPNFSFSALFAGYAALSLSGAISFFGVRPLPKKTDMVPPKEALKMVGETLIDKDLLQLAPLIIAYGVNLTYIFGYFPDGINSTKWSSLSLTLFGLVHIIVSVSGGSIAKYMGGNLLVYISTFGVILGAILGTIAGSHNIGLAIVAAMFLGFMEAGFLIQFFNTSGRDFESKRQVSINCVFRLLCAGSMAVLFFMAPVLSYDSVVIMVIVIQLLGVVLFLNRWRKRRQSGVTPKETSNERKFVNLAEE